MILAPFLTGPWLWVIAGVVLALSHGYAFYQGRLQERGHQQATMVKAMITMTEQFKEEVANGNKIAEAYEKERSVRTSTERKLARAGQLRIIEVPVARADCPSVSLSLGYMRLHDCAARGDAGDACTTPQPDDATPVNLTATQTLAVAIQNYSVCLAEFEKLKSLQIWVKSNCK